MSIQSEIDRISQNVVNTYSVLEDAGAVMPASLTTQNLPDTAASIQAVLFKEQTLTKEQKVQARNNLGIIGKANVIDYGASPDATAATNTSAFQSALIENRVVFVPGGTYELNNTLTIGANCCLELSQDTVLKFTQTDTHGISMLRLATLRGNHATIFVPYTFSANVINCDGGDDYNALDPDDITGSNTTAVPPFKKWDPQWKMSRYVMDINICKPNSSGFHYSDDGTCYGTAIYVHNNTADYPVRYMWGINMSGIRIAGGFNYGIRLYNIGPHKECWNHDARIEAVIDACKIGVSVENAYYNHLAVTIQPRPANDGTAYAEHGVKIVDSWGTDLSSYRVWDWTTKDEKTGKTINSKWEAGNEYQHLAMYGNCTGTLIDGFLTYAQSTYDIRELIYTDTPSNLKKMTVMQEPIDRWFKTVEGVPYYFDGNADKKLTTQEDIDAYFDADMVKGFEDALAMATDIDNTVYNGVGYKAGYRLNTDGTLIAGADNTYTVTGFIPCTVGQKVYVEGMSLDTVDDGCRVCLYDTSKNFIRFMSLAGLVASGWYVAGEKTENGFWFSPQGVVGNENTAYVRFCVFTRMVGKYPMASVDEEIKYTAEGFLADGIKVKPESIMLVSPNGTQYRLSVNNDGTLTTTAVTE